MERDGKLFIPMPDKYPELILGENAGANMREEIQKQFEENLRRLLKKWIEENNGYNGL